MRRRRTAPSHLRASLRRLTICRIGYKEEEPSGTNPPINNYLILFIMLQLQFIGNLGKDAQVKTTKEGREFLSFSVAVKTGENETTWLDVAANGGAKIAEYLRKGREVFVQGNLRVSMYNGQPQLQVNGAMIQLVGKQKEEEEKKEEDGKTN